MTISSFFNRLLGTETATASVMNTVTFVTTRARGADEPNPESTTSYTTPQKGYTVDLDTATVYKSCEARKVKGGDYAVSVIETVVVASENPGYKRSYTTATQVPNADGTLVFDADEAVSALKSFEKHFGSQPEYKVSGGAEPRHYKKYEPKP